MIEGGPGKQGLVLKWVLSGTRENSMIPWRKVSDYFLAM